MTRSATIGIDPCATLSRPVCLSSVSKDVEGKFEAPEASRRECGEPRCLTLTTYQVLTLRMGSHDDCDRVVDLDGQIEVRDLVHVFDEDGNQRGMHSGQFRWESGIGLIFGALSGITNAGTHRQPAFDECQRCRAAVMEGQLCGRVCHARDERYSDCQVLGSYRLRIDSAADGVPSQGVTGTFEGVLICRCRT